MYPPVQLGNKVPHLVIIIGLLAELRGHQQHVPSFFSLNLIVNADSPACHIDSFLAHAIPEVAEFIRFINLLPCTGYAVIFNSTIFIQEFDKHPLVVKVQVLVNASHINHPRISIILIFYPFQLFYALFNLIILLHFPCQQKHGLWSRDMEKTCCKLPFLGHLSPGHQILGCLDLVGIGQLIQKVVNILLVHTLFIHFPFFFYFW